AWRAARALDAGTVWVNRYNRSFAEAPSGGVRQSGLGRTRGLEGVRQFTETKHVNWEVSAP
ncbi:MAG: betaine-aldehyde dehydrogenase, partial [Solirubrobacteraceae bacterium]|nr:betaine-aldehyde dehydrogenase [Solirubrobacteraceae bacterium]